MKITSKTTYNGIKLQDGYDLVRTKFAIPREIKKALLSFSEESDMSMALITSIALAEYLERKGRFEL